ncbi:MAG: adenylyl-sulfate kinase [Bacteroidales bacterium]|nr:adenylyl-sulfate kinase [Bacteroidales bacterium]
MHNHLHNEMYLTREDKEKYLKQHARALWLTGYPASGKTTIANGLESVLAGKGFFTRVFDGDIIRRGINSDLGYSVADRYENIRRIAEINALFIQSGIITINAFISPTREIRDLARKIIGSENFIEVFVDASLEVCISRDPKGMFKKAIAGEIRDFTGIDAPYEAPLHPDLVIDTEHTTEEQAIELAARFVTGRVQYLERD